MDTAQDFWREREMKFWELKKEREEKKKETKVELSEILDLELKRKIEI